jgi:hypothetical protein
MIGGEHQLMAEEGMEHALFRPSRGRRVRTMSMSRRAEFLFSGRSLRMKRLPRDLENGGGNSPRMVRKSHWRW